MTPSVLHLIPCEDALPDPRNLHLINVYGLTTRIRSDQVPPFPFRHQMQKVLIVFRGGMGIGKFVIRVKDDKTGQVATQSKRPHRVQFAGDPGEVVGAVVRVHDCKFRHEGVYWIKLVFGGEVLARQPIRVLS
jgi:hypothetical protein